MMNKVDVTVVAIVVVSILTAIAMSVDILNIL